MNETFLSFDGWLPEAADDGSLFGFPAINSSKSTELLFCWCLPKGTFLSFDGCGERREPTRESVKVTWCLQTLVQKLSEAEVCDCGNITTVTTPWFWPNGTTASYVIGSTPIGYAKHCFVQMQRAG